jgi:AraC family transcriptional regulator
MDMNETRIFGRGAAGIDPGQLVRQAMTFLESDRDAARRCLREASTLLGPEPPQSGSMMAGTALCGPGGLAPWQARQTFAYIEENISSRIAIAGLAGRLALSKSHFSRAFKQRVGLSPMQYVTLRRVERAKSLISSTRQPLAQIALICGFTDQSHLSRRFHELVGECPGKWRRSLERHSQQHADPITAIADQ